MLPLPFTPLWVRCIGDLFVPLRPENEENHIKMKEIARIVLSMFCFVLCSLALEAQCPFGGKVNCHGECGRFTDENGDGLCDFGKIEKTTPEVKKDSTKTADTSERKTKAERAKTDVQTSNPKTPAQTIHSIAKEQDLESEEEQAEEIALAETETVSQTAEIAAPSVLPKPYRVKSITLICLLAYLLTYLLVRFKKIQKLTHRRIWNSVLLVTFLVSCLLGFFLAIQLNYHLAMGVFSDILKLHVEFGLAMTIIGVIHVIWHLKYYLHIFKK